MIPYGRQDITQADLDAVADVLRSDFLTQGPQVPLFEGAVATAVNADHAVAVNSATSALHIACLALGLGAGDILWTSPITFVASANVGLLCGADVDFVDIDSETFNMCADALAAKLALAKTAGRLPKVLMPVHMCGQSCDMAAIHALAQQYGIKVIEDASHAIGGQFLGRPVGDCRYSDITVFSFHPVKIVTTAEGGVATTNDAELAQKMRLAASHGVTRDPDLMDKPSEGGWYYQQISLGLNYRMTEMQAALGASQMTRLREYVSKRNALAARYDAALGNLALKRPAKLDGAYCAYHLYVIRVDPMRRAAVFADLRAAGIGVNVHYHPVHLQPFWRARGFATGMFPASEAYYASAISIPLYPGLTDGDQQQVVDAITQALK